MEAVSETFAEHFLPTRGKRRSPLAPDTHIEVLWSSTLDDDVATWRKVGYTRVGQSDTLSKAAARGPTQELAELGRSVGAGLVLFCIWPAKLKAVKRTQEGEIDLWAVMADAPTSFSPRSYAVTRAIFMARPGT
jgi:hypothetical protein